MNDVVTQCCYLKAANEDGWHFCYRRFRDARRRCHVAELLDLRAEWFVPDLRITSSQKNNDRLLNVCKCIDAFAAVTVERISGGALVWGDCHREILISTC